MGSTGSAPLTPSSRTFCQHRHVARGGADRAIIHWPGKGLLTWSKGTGFPAWLLTHFWQPHSSQSAFPLILKQLVSYGSMDPLDALVQWTIFFCLVSWFFLTPCSFYICILHEDLIKIHTMNHHWSCNDFKICILTQTSFLAPVP